MLADMLADVLADIEGVSSGCVRLAGAAVDHTQTAARVEIVAVPRISNSFERIE